jgi:hypothetical protein
MIKISNVALNKLCFVKDTKDGSNLPTALGSTTSTLGCHSPWQKVWTRGQNLAEIEKVPEPA